MFSGPHPDAWGAEGGLFTLFYTLLPRLGVILVSTWFKPKKWQLKLSSVGVYCAWLQGLRGSECTGTHQSLLGFPWLYEWTDRLETLKLWTVQSMYTCFCRRWTRTHFITIAWNVINTGTYTVCFFFFLYVTCIISERELNMLRNW